MASTYGKMMYLDMGKICIVSGLGMTGSWSIQSKDIPRPKHTRAFFTLDSFENLYYTDIRKFGYLDFMSFEEVIKKTLIMGGDLLNFSLKDSMDAVDKLRKKPNRNICEALMDQKIIAGIGNYIKCEALYRSKIHPYALIKDLSTEQLFTLFANAMNVAKESFEHGGNSFKDYVHVDGTAGEFAFRLAVYGRKVDPLNNEVKKIITSDGRNTYFAPSVQVYK